jgi:predicted HAD superfamily hydrolase
MAHANYTLFANLKNEPEKILVSSFDVFHTLLARLQLKPTDRFRSAYRRLDLGSVDFQGLIQLRKRGEANAARRRGPDLYSLEDIYREMGQGKELGAALLDRAKEAEMEMEREQCFAIASGRSYLIEATQSLRKIIYVSDMYLPPALIHELLERNGLWVPGARLFVSHAEGCAKHSGLFEKICIEMDIRPAQMRHVGDDFNADVAAPQKIGIRTAPFYVARPTRYEMRFRKTGLDTVADAVRAARLQNPASANSSEGVIWDTACGVAAPLFVAYVAWLRQTARVLGIDRLYFVSRDGLIFKKIYDLLEKKRPQGGVSHYLYGSRQAWICARLVRLDAEDVSFLTFQNPTLSLAQLFRRCDLDAADLDAPPWDPQRRNLEAPLMTEHIRWIREALREGTWREIVQKRAKQRLEEAREYFCQEKLGNSSYALVDLGWFGNLQNYVGGIWPENPPKHGFYLDLRKSPKIQIEKKASSFLASPKMVGIDQSTSITLLEILATAPHGSCLGYKKNQGRWGPELEKGEGYYGGYEKIDLQHEAILKVAENLLSQESNPDVWAVAPWRDVAQQNFICLLQNPLNTEAAVLGAVDFVSRQEGGAGVEFGPRCSLSEASKYFIQGFRVRDAAWPQAMICRSRGINRILLWLRHHTAQVKAGIGETFVKCSRAILG